MTRETQALQFTNKKLQSSGREGRSSLTQPLEEADPSLTQPLEVADPSLPNLLRWQIHPDQTSGGGRSSLTQTLEVADSPWPNLWGW